jgi:gustatory receptor
VVLLCDTIRNEFEDLLLHFHKLECNAELPSDENEMSALIKSLSRCVPEFTAARYFYVDRSTILSLFNSITTFLLVMIQFK